LVGIYFCKEIEMFYYKLYYLSKKLKNEILSFMIIKIK